eukprot:g4578.t1
MLNHPDMFTSSDDCCAPGQEHAYSSQQYQSMDGAFAAWEGQWNGGGQGELVHAGGESFQYNASQEYDAFQVEPNMLQQPGGYEVGGVLCQTAAAPAAEEGYVLDPADFPPLSVNFIGSPLGSGSTKSGATSPGLAASPVEESTESSQKNVGKTGRSVLGSGVTTETCQVGAPLRSTQYATDEGGWGGAAWSSFGGGRMEDGWSNFGGQMRHMNGPLAGAAYGGGNSDYYGQNRGYGHNGGRVLGQHSGQNQQRNNYRYRDNQNYERDNGESAERDVCVFWWRGRCVKGKHCQWRHPLLTPGRNLMSPTMNRVNTGNERPLWNGRAYGSPPNPANANGEPAALGSSRPATAVAARTTAVAGSASSSQFRTRAQLCTFWKDGTCRNGVGCPFAHPRPGRIYDPLQNFPAAARKKQRAVEVLAAPQRGRATCAAGDGISASSSRPAGNTPQAGPQQQQQLPIHSHQMLLGLVVALVALWLTWMQGGFLFGN